MAEEARDKMAALLAEQTDIRAKMQGGWDLNIELGQGGIAIGAEAAL